MKNNNKNKKKAKQKAEKKKAEQQIIQQQAAEQQIIQQQAAEQQIIQQQAAEQQIIQQQAAEQQIIQQQAAEQQIIQQQAAEQQIIQQQAAEQQIIQQQAAEQQIIQQQAAEQQIIQQQAAEQQIIQQQAAEQQDRKGSKRANTPELPEQVIGQQVEGQRETTETKVAKHRIKFEGRELKIDTELARGYELVVRGETDQYSITPTTFRERDYLSNIPSSSSTSSSSPSSSSTSSSSPSSSSTSSSSPSSSSTSSSSPSSSSTSSSSPSSSSTSSSSPSSSSTSSSSPSSSSTSSSPEVLNYLKSFKTFQDTFEYNGNKVVRFGLNRIAIDSKLIKSEEAKKRQVEEAKKKHEEPETKLSNSDTKSQHSAGTGGSRRAPQDKLINTSIEEDLVRGAIKYLLDDKSDSMKTVLVDIFTRENKTIVVDSSGNLEPHTVVLYKPTPNRAIVLVIDPNNFTYSNYLNSIENDRVSILSSDSDLKIYVGTKGNTGPGPNQFRDCIDIAVKISFILNSQLGFLTSNITSFTKPDVSKFVKLVKSISNQVTIDSDYPQDLIDTNNPVRIKQTSDITIVNTFNQIQKSIYLFHAMLSQEPLFKAYMQKVMASYNKILSTTDNYYFLLEAMRTFYTTTCSEYVELWKKAPEFSLPDVSTDPVDHANNDIALAGNDIEHA